MPIPLPNPGDIVASSWGQDVAEAINSLAGPTATYTPTVSNITLGSGATNEATYKFVGGPNVSDAGVIVIDGRIIFGTGLAISAAPALTLPAGFEFTSTTTGNVGYASYVKFNAAGTGTGGQAGVVRWGGGVSLFTPSIYQVSGTNVAIVAITASIPGTWVAGGTIYYGLVAPVRQT